MSLPSLSTPPRPIPWYRFAGLRLTILSTTALITLAVAGLGVQTSELARQQALAEQIHTTEVATMTRLDVFAGGRALMMYSLTATMADGTQVHARYRPDPLFGPRPPEVGEQVEVYLFDDRPPLLAPALTAMDRPLLWMIGGFFGVIALAGLWGVRLTAKLWQRHRTWPLVWVHLEGKDLDAPGPLSVQIEGRTITLALQRQARVDWIRSGVRSTRGAWAPLLVGPESVTPWLHGTPGLHAPSPGVSHVGHS